MLTTLAMLYDLEIVRVLIARLEAQQRPGGPDACEENATALMDLRRVLTALEARQEKRLQQDARLQEEARAKAAG